ncbi:endolytic transglycosylase MltG [Calidifontibacillus oryziterrae]|uniref:endolytic transglycosylase MltG n=1 Tax=Calidifontibacillus oryziterrae TaxID=1191699 RepID=UPI0002F4211F|nr:endolytic transglycosylase MltG [Calidifontibacillus oryziterrae]
MGTSNQNQKDYRAKYKERVQEAHLVRKIVFIIVSIITLVLIGVSITGYLYINSALQPVNEEDETTVSITIPIGSSVRGIANILEENDIIKDGTVFRYYVKFKNESGFQAGDYELSPSMELNEIIAHLKTGKVIKEALFSITIPEGKNLEQIATILSNKTDFSEEEIIEKLDSEAYVKELMKQYPTIITEEVLNKNIRHPLEGYLFPATYQYYDVIKSIEEVVEPMISKTEEMVSGFVEQMEEKGLSIHEFITMASLIEEEATEKADREKISSVFYNRISQNMPLQTDPTVLYSLGKHQVQITLNDLETDSPYNTYINIGLPPGPIASPGEISMAAAVNPANGNFLYFYSRPNGETIFTKTLAEHNNVKNKYKHEWDEFKENE